MFGVFLARQHDSYCGGFGPRLTLSFLLSILINILFIAIT